MICIRVLRALKSIPSLIVNFAVIIALVSVPQTAFPEIPSVITYQGNIHGPGGPVDGSLEITISIYNVRSGPDPALWTETHAAVEVINGKFTLEMGSINPLGLLFDEPYYLGVQVDDDSEMTPRMPFSSVGYAVRSLHSQNANRAQNSDKAQNSDRAQNADRARNADVADYALNLHATTCIDGEVLRKGPSEWVCSTVVGEPGPQGAQGPEGEQGSQGDQGIQGERGPKGLGLGNIKNYAVVIKGHPDDSDVSGTGVYTSIIDAVDSAAEWCFREGSESCTIRVFPGLYESETIYLPWQFKIQGSGISATILSFPESCQSAFRLAGNNEINGLSVAVTDATEPCDLTTPAISPYLFGGSKPIQISNVLIEDYDLGLKWGGTTFTNVEAGAVTLSEVTAGSINSSRNTLRIFNSQVQDVTMTGDGAFAFGKLSVRSSQTRELSVTDGYLDVTGSEIDSVFMDRNWFLDFLNYHPHRITNSFIKGDVSIDGQRLEIISTKIGGTVSSVSGYYGIFCLNAYRWQNPSSPALLLSNSCDL